MCFRLSCHKTSYCFDSVGKIPFILCTDKANVRFFRYCHRLFCFFLSRYTVLYFLDSHESLFLQKLRSLLKSVPLLFYVWRVLVHMWWALSMDKFIHLFIADSTVTGKAPHSVRLLKGHSMKKSSFTQAFNLRTIYLVTGCHFKDVPSLLIYNLKLIFLELQRERLALMILSF